MLWSLIAFFVLLFMTANAYWSWLAVWGDEDFALHEKIGMIVFDLIMLGILATLIIFTYEL